MGVEGAVRPDQRPALGVARPAAGGQVEQGGRQVDRLRLVLLQVKPVDRPLRLQLGLCLINLRTDIRPAALMVDGNVLGAVQPDRTQVGNLD